MRPSRPVSCLGEVWGAWLPLAGDAGCDRRTRQIGTLVRLLKC